jgi:hypothetical protein
MSVFMEPRGRWTENFGNHWPEVSYGSIIMHSSDAGGENVLQWDSKSAIYKLRERENICTSYVYRNSCLLPLLSRLLYIHIKSLSHVI